MEPRNEIPLCNQSTHSSGVPCLGCTCLLALVRIHTAAVAAGLEGMGSMLLCCCRSMGKWCIPLLPLGVLGRGVWGRHWQVRECKNGACWCFHWRRQRHPTPVLLPGKSMDGGAWWASIYGVTQSRTRLKRLSSNACFWLLSP